MIWRNNIVSRILREDLSSIPLSDLSVSFLVADPNYNI